MALAAAATSCDLDALANLLPASARAVMRCHDASADELHSRDSGRVPTGVAGRSRGDSVEQMTRTSLLPEQYSGLMSKSVATAPMLVHVPAAQV